MVGVQVLCLPSVVQDSVLSGRPGRVIIGPVGHGRLTTRLSCFLFRDMEEFLTASEGI